MKTGTHKELAPYEANWIFTRAAAIARHLYISGKGLGTQTLRTKFGSRMRRGTVSSIEHKADGKIIRYCTKMMEKMGLVDIIVKQVQEEGGKTHDLCSMGKKVTKKGRTEMDKIASQIYKKMYPRKAISA